MRRKNPGSFGAMCLCVGLLNVSACDDDKAGGTAATTKSEGKADAETKTEPQADASGKAPQDEAKTDAPPANDKDRGEGSAQIGARQWAAATATVRIEDGRLRLSISRMDKTEQGIERDAFSLVIDDYTGPGDYTTKGMSSNFTGVGFDVERAKAAVDADGKTDDAKITAQAIDSMKKAEVILMSGTEIHIESATDEQVVGTFSWQPSGSMSNKPAVTDGKFRAAVRKKK